VGRWLWGPRGDPIIKANPFETEAFYVEILAELAGACKPSKINKQQKDKPSTMECEAPLGFS
jgi:hypothetical protein